ncbi:MAG: rRNA maturation RNase YbeY [Patescibacteria group bacterium]
MAKICSYSALAERVRGAFPRFLRKRLPTTVVVVCLNARESEKINLLYRGKKSATNVLSFRYGPDYGEVLVCPAVIRDEARRDGQAFSYRMTWMVVHGMLHLAGVHHEKSPKMAQRFERVEKGILDILCF